MHYNDVLEPCMEAQSSESCDGQAGEIDGALAYRSWVASQWSSIAATPALVAFHNLVTVSIEAKYLQGQQQHLYCAQNAAAEVPAEYVGDLTLPQAGTLAPVAVGVPGLDPDSSTLPCR
ncbi:unnamed protein product [Prorocentrum cordatum]|uniref:Uncharacterized protein n=1 Tax=Prorocentrum cordatum TaxID=2364126 RepID=A0ABN9TMY1_9DINO|nr:unnamed protein product [Polarella glacialis]|mmetsp:Transcript_29575/g.77478  ORF Transcript_29575/g.77478 Transcript_29575/m.77478 type:complete len:119 (-) Transcript_29575:632-988(-)